MENLNTDKNTDLDDINKDDKTKYNTHNTLEINKEEKKLIEYLFSNAKKQPISYIEIRSMFG